MFYVYKYRTAIYDNEGVLIGVTALKDNEEKGYSDAYDAFDLVNPTNGCKVVLEQYTYDNKDNLIEMKVEEIKQ